MASDLRGRVAARAQAQQPQPGNEVATTKKVADLVREMEPQFQMAMPKGMEATQLVRDIMTMLSQTPKLKECVPATVLGGAMTMAQLGLRPGVLGQGWLLPFWDKRDQAMKAQLVIGYKGYLELIGRTGRVYGPAAHAVHANDYFELGVRDGQRTFTHEVNWWADRGPLLGWYATAQEQGAPTLTVTDPMSVKQMEDHRDRFAMARTKDGTVVGPWRDDFESMAKKTMLLQLAKMLPKSTELQIAIEADGKVRVDTAVDAAGRSEPVIDGEVVGDTTDAADAADAAVDPTPTPPPSPGPQAPTPGGQGQQQSPPPRETGEAATQAQLTKLVKLLEERGIKSDEAQHTALSEAVGRPVTSRKELTKAEASGLIDRLTAAPKPEAGQGGGDQS